MDANRTEKIRKIGISTQRKEHPNFVEGFLNMVHLCTSIREEAPKAVIEAKMAECMENYETWTELEADFHQQIAEV